MILKSALLLSVIGAASAAPPGHRLPRTEAETASGRAITLPDAAAGRVAILVVGFSKTSREVTERWERQVFQDYGSAPRVAVFRVAVLESVPRLLRGFVRGRIEKNVPNEKRDGFVLLFHHEEEWKTLVRFAAPDDAYFIVLEGAGNVSWVGHGGPALEGYGELKAQIDLLARRGQQP